MAHIFRRAAAVIPVFKPAMIANAFKVCTLFGDHPGRHIVDQMCVRACEVIADFAPSDISLMLLGCATLGEKPSATVVDRLFRRAMETNSEYKPQDVCNILWASSVLSLTSEGFLVFKKCVKTLTLVLKGECENADLALSQIAQFLLTVTLETPEWRRTLGVQEASAVELVNAAVKDYKLTTTVPKSTLQAQVAAALRRLKLRCQEDAIDPKSGYSIDVLVEARVAVEADGPMRFLSNGKTPTGATLLKKRHLKLLGYTVVLVPYWEWTELGEKDRPKREEAYLKQLLCA
jgi:hypothetical protein